MDEKQIDTIAVNLLTPLIARLIGWAGASLATVGITFTANTTSAASIAAIVVGLAGVVYNQMMARATAVSNAKKAYTQGASAAGVTLTPSEVPKVVSNGAAVTDAASAPLGVQADAQGNISLTLNKNDDRINQ